jgi:B-box zinc finger
LPKNIFVAKLLAMKEAPSSTSTKLCGPCSANRTRSRDKINKAVAFCVDCRENLCENCRYVHSKLTMSRTHRTLAVKELLNTPTTCPPAVCDKHLNMDLEMFCVDCQEALCMVCFVTQHFGHKSDKITQIVSSFRQDISKNITELQRTSLQTITQDLKNVQDRRRKCVEVCARADELKATIEKHKQQLLIQLTKVKTRKLKDIDNTIYEITQDKALLESFIKYSEELLQKGSDGDIAKESKNLKLTSMEMKQLCEQNREILLSETEVTFTPSEDAFERRRGNCVNWVGSLSGEVLYIATDGVS